VCNPGGYRLCRCACVVVVTVRVGVSVVYVSSTFTTFTLILVGLRWFELYRYLTLKLPSLLDLHGCRCYVAITAVLPCVALFYVPVCPRFRYCSADLRHDCRYVVRCVAAFLFVVGAVGYVRCLPVGCVVRYVWQRVSALPYLRWDVGCVLQG
jgi:hypothetical protein